MRHYRRCVDPARLSAPDADTFISGLHEHKTQACDCRVAKGVLARPGVKRLISGQASGRLAIATTTSRSNVDILLSTTLADPPPGPFEVIGAGEQAAEKSLPRTSTPG